MGYVVSMFAGSFDPPTFGHLNIIERSCRLFDRVDVVIAVNPDKKYHWAFPLAVAARLPADAARHSHLHDRLYNLSASI